MLTRRNRRQNRMKVAKACWGLKHKKIGDTNSFEEI